MKDLSYYLALPYEILVRPLSPEEGGGYLARYKDYPLVMGDGESEESRWKSSVKRLRMWVEVLTTGGA